MIPLAVTKAVRGVACEADDLPVVMTDPAGNPVAYGTVEGREHRLRIPDVGDFHFEPHGERIVAIPFVGASPDAVADAYRSIALPMALQTSGWEVLHAAATLGERGVVAFCASSGIGKTTIAYALSRRGQVLWADDVLVIEGQIGGLVLAQPLPFHSNLRVETREYFGLGTAATPRSGGEHPVAPLAAIFILERTNGPVSIDRLRGAEALEALLPHSLRFDLTDVDLRRRTVESYLALIARVPVLNARFTASFDLLDRLLDAIERAVADATAKRH